MYDPNQQQQQQQFDPSQQQWNQQWYVQQQKNPKGYAVTSLILFVIGWLLHIMLFIPAIGIVFGCFGLIVDVIALICLIVVVASL